MIRVVFIVSAPLSACQKTCRLFKTFSRDRRDLNEKALLLGSSMEQRGKILILALEDGDLPWIKKGGDN
jgi:hypothetical protein